MAKKNYLLPAAIVCVILLAVFSFTDLNISLALYNPENWFGRFFEAFGELPGNLVAVFCCAALLAARDTRSRIVEILSLVIFGAGMIAASYVAGTTPFHYIDGPEWLGYLLAAAFGVGSLYLCLNLAEKDRDALRAAAVIGIATYLVAVISINLIKVLWGRPRLRSMTDPAAEFTPWYRPQGWNTDNEFKSFPSGHSATAAVIIWISMIPRFIPALRRREGLFTCVALAWTVMVMLSRIIMGAHFASDTLVGASITIFSYYGLRRWLGGRLGMKPPNEAGIQ
ncbi:MAG: phosphatase PAP2 family protein [Clostridiales bacterium]|nr:phosphatase PAP2 family protein [Clostridiales bacterium]